MTEMNTYPEFPKGCRTLPEMLEHTAATWPDRIAYQWFDRATEAWASITWKEFLSAVRRWQKALKASGLKKGDRVAVLLTNSIESLLIDQSVLACGMTPVPMHAIDTPSACAFVLSDSGARALVTASEARWHSIRDADPTLDLSALGTVVLCSDTPTEKEFHGTPRVEAVTDWLAAGEDYEIDPADRPAPEDLAALVYTSGTTGRPNGVMLTHSALVANCSQTWQCLPLTEQDVSLSYLPLSHAFERTVAYYLAVAVGSQLVISRGIQSLTEDMQHAQPTTMNTVPRVLEKIHTSFVNQIASEGEAAVQTLAWAQEVGWRRFCRKNSLPVEHSPREELDDAAWPDLDAKIGTRVRALFGGRIRDLISGGAALNYSIAKFFCAMGINLRQGYGLTESAPVISMSETVGNHPTTVGKPLPGIEVKLGANDELLVRGPQVMKGYWHRPDATKETFTEDGFLKTGDQADLSDGGRIRIKGRIKEIIVTSTGEKIPPVDLEFAIQSDPLFEQVMIIGEDRPFVAVLVVVNPTRWENFCAELSLDPKDPASYESRQAQRAVLQRIRKLTRQFPQYGVPRAVRILSEHWTPENGMTTSTMKLRRRVITKHYLALIEELYANSKA